MLSTLLLRKMLIDEAVISLTNVPSNIQLHHEIARDVAAVHAVPGVVRDVLYNLLTNAIEAMPDGGKITLRAYNTRRYVFVEVSDTGIGITPDKRDKIFGFLYSTKGSTGFGLWSARRKALQNGGDLRLTESRPGGGTTFTLSLPRIKQ
jgi:signal transduction histidine kinase